MDVLQWIEKELNPKECNSVDFMYDDMESQSGKCLPVIYQPFDANKRSHWRDRGACYDYLYSSNSEDKKLLDFGPGDGWPSLIVAPYAKEVIGVDASQRRVDVCVTNAKRLGLSNTTFVHVESGKPLPFDDETFDSVVAASSIEQASDPRSTLRELHRIMKTGGYLRIDYEALGMYKGGREQEAFLDKVDDATSVVTLYDRRYTQEKATMYKIFISQPVEEVKAKLCEGDETFSFSQVALGRLSRVVQHVTESRMCTLNHPYGRTFVIWLKHIGFDVIFPSYSGAWFAGQVFDHVPENNRPGDMSGVDEILKPLVRIVVQMAAPIGLDPMITAIK